MEFDTSSPIWGQLVAEFSRLIVTSQWPAGSKIPGVRDLARQLAVNPNTVQRALAELERDGFCHSERTNGRFVTDETDRIDALRSQLAQEAVDQFITTARGLGMDAAHAHSLLTSRWEPTTDRRDQHDHHTNNSEGR